MDLLSRGAYAASEGSRSTVAFLGDRSAAVARQDCDGGPLIVGPIVAENEVAVLPLVHALVEKHFEGKGGDATRDIDVSLMVVDHPNVVSLLEGAGMTKVGENPSMTSDGKSVYHKGDGMYVAMMHPTLG